MTVVNHNPHDTFHKLALILIVLVILSNQGALVKIERHLHGGQITEAKGISGNFQKDVASLVTPTSLPFYGPELGLNFSNTQMINASIARLAEMAPKQGSKPIELNEEEMKRYIKIGTEPTITCEFCCGVKTLVYADGSPTCGCAHSIAMRGTAAYLIKNYPQLTDAEIAYELMRQKGLYFPKQMQERMANELAGDSKDFTPDIRYLTQNLTSAELNSLRKKSIKEGFKPLPAADMVGGC